MIQIAGDDQEIDDISNFSAERRSNRSNDINKPSDDNSSNHKNI